LALSAIRKLYSNGAVISGSSAGTTIHVGGIKQKYPMVTGGESYQALRDGPFSDGENLVDPDDLTYDPNGGFMFFNYGLVDTHFGNRGRQGRQVRLADHSGIPFTFGADQDTAIVVTDADTPNARMKILGTDGVYIFDLRNSYPGNSIHWSIYNVTVNYITLEDIYDPHSKKIHFASWKTPLHGREPHIHANVTNDIFSSPNNSDNDGRRNPREFTKICVSLFESKQHKTHGYTFETNPTFRVDFTKVGHSAGYQGTSEMGLSLTSFQNLRMDIYVDSK